MLDNFGSQRVCIGFLIESLGIYCFYTGILLLSAVNPDVGAGKQKVVVGIFPVGAIILAFGGRK